MTASRTYGLAGMFAALLVVLMFLLHGAQTEAAGDTPITGYAWSDTIGWVDLNCSNSNVCGTNNFGLSVASDGTVSGYAWSDSIGWVSANASDVAGCPSSPCTPNISSGAFTGWLKALSADGNGWDGWISLSGTSPSYGVTENGNGTFTGFAWGSDVVGWVDFSLASTTYDIATCTPATAYSCSGQTIVRSVTDAHCSVTQTNITTCVSPGFCSTGSSTCLYPPPAFNASNGGYTGHLQALPTIVPQGMTTKLFWDVANVSSCSVTGANGDHWTGDSSGTSGVTTAGIIQQTVFTLACTGLDNSVINETATVNILPTFQER